MRWKVPAASCHGDNSQPSSQGYLFCAQEGRLQNLYPRLPQLLALFGYRLRWILLGVGSFLGVPYLLFHAFPQEQLPS